MIKGCINQECNSCNKQIHYTKKTYNFCPECGFSLHHVCKKCHMVLEDDEKQLCLRCEQEKEVKKDQVKDGFGKAGATALAIGAVVPGVIKAVKDKML